MQSVLIESDWNLKLHISDIVDFGTPVLIESDWNLKCLTSQLHRMGIICINRIRLEFKGIRAIVQRAQRTPVLIESDWNLKFYKFHVKKICGIRY